MIAVTGRWPATRGGKTFCTWSATNLAISLLPGSLGCLVESYTKQVTAGLL